MTRHPETSFRSNLQRQRIKGVRQVEAAGLLGFSSGCRVGKKARCENELTALDTWAALGRFEWSRAKIVYSERKAGSAIIPASS